MLHGKVVLTSNSVINDVINDETLTRWKFLKLQCPCLGLDVWEAEFLGLGLDHEAYVLGLDLGSESPVPLGLGVGF